MKKIEEDFLNDNVTKTDSSFFDIKNDLIIDNSVLKNNKPMKLIIKISLFAFVFISLIGFVAIGVEAKEDTVFSLFFTLDGASYDLLTNGYFYLEIYDRYHQLVAEIEEELEICTLNKTIRAQIYAGEETLPYGNYYINLKVDYNDTCYVLISENEMILSIK